MRPLNARYTFFCYVSSSGGRRDVLLHLKPVSTHDSCLHFFCDPPRWLNGKKHTQKINQCNEEEIDGKGDEETRGFKPYR